MAKFTPEELREAAAVLLRLAEDYEQDRAAHPACDIANEAKWQRHVRMLHDVNVGYRARVTFLLSLAAELDEE